MPKHVMMIEDDVKIAAALRVRLEAAGYQTSAAENGASGLATASSQTPDVILLDLRLPDVDGIEVCRRLKAQPKTAKTPVIILSANVSNVTCEQARQFGAVGCMSKPYEIQDVISAIESVTGPTPREAA